MACLALQLTYHRRLGQVINHLSLQSIFLRLSPHNHSLQATSDPGSSLTQPCGFQRDQEHKASFRTARESHKESRGWGKKQRAESKVSISPPRTAAACPATTPLHLPALCNCRKKPFHSTCSPFQPPLSATQDMGLLHSGDIGGHQVKLQTSFKREEPRS